MEVMRKSVVLFGEGHSSPESRRNITKNTRILQSPSLHEKMMELGHFLYASSDHTRSLQGWQQTVVRTAWQIALCTLRSFVWSKVPEIGFVSQQNTNWHDSTGLIPHLTHFPSCSLNAITVPPPPNICIFNFRLKVLVSLLWYHKIFHISWT